MVKSMPCRGSYGTRPTNLISQRHNGIVFTYKPFTPTPQPMQRQHTHNKREKHINQLDLARDSGYMNSWKSPPAESNTKTRERMAS